MWGFFVGWLVGLAKNKDKPLYFIVSGSHMIDFN